MKIPTELIEAGLDQPTFDAIHDTWPDSNRERGKLIDKYIAGTITPEEGSQLSKMNAYIVWRLDSANRMTIYAPKENTD